jgi:hypothetical protein
MFHSLVVFFGPGAGHSLELGVWRALLVRQSLRLGPWQLGFKGPN